MPYLLSPQLTEFYEKGLFNILRFIPKNLAEEERLVIEGIVYTAYGYFRTYSALEMLLENNTNSEGVLANDSSAIARDAFSYAWSLVDSAYALSKLVSVHSARNLIRLSEDSRTGLNEASVLRNYVDHLSNNFNNAVRAQGWFPLFGWLSYQLSPFMREEAAPKNLYFVVNLGSTHLKDECNVSAPECSSHNVLSSIDNLILHVRKRNRVNLSRLFVNLTLDLNEFSISTQQYLTSLVSEPNFDHGGLRIPFPRLIIRADMGEHELSAEEITSTLNYNKIRVEVHLDPVEGESGPR